MKQKTYHRPTGSLIARTADRMPELPERLMNLWIWNPRALECMLDEGFSQKSLVKNLPTWVHCSFDCTTGKTPQDFMATYKRLGVYVDEHAQKALDLVINTNTNPASGTHELVGLTYRNLGLTLKTPFADFCRQVVDLGLEECHPMTGPVLRISPETWELLPSRKRPGNEIWIGMKPIVPNSVERVFVIAADQSEGPYLDTARLDSIGQPMSFFEDTSIVLFKRPQT